ncbi:MAG: hypothetical protein QF384_06310 [Alphaproteobacteria bacterium]|jgi:hypothetical protein|nr:hypothetical protein [Alphaproteobacteria bacterium]MDP6832459.1 hypothetical protein [Alphaproteobacteria bacterium]MDP6875629.1 hypothetical protein [Alphaproteobacteria bacterium]
MFEFAGAWEGPINYLFLIVTGAVAVHAIRHRDKEGKSDAVRLLFGCIAAVFFMLVLFQDVLGVVKFS